jgi:hypothetical protein
MLPDLFLVDKNRGRVVAKGRPTFQLIESK